MKLHVNKENAFRAWFKRLSGKSKADKNNVLMKKDDITMKKDDVTCKQERHSDRMTEKMKADKEKAFRVWFKCVQHQYLSWKREADLKHVTMKKDDVSRKQACRNGGITEKMLADLKHVIVKRFVNQDGVYRLKGRLLSKEERNELAALGVGSIKQWAFEVFRPDFERYVKSPGYKNMCNYCKKNYNKREK